MDVTTHVNYVFDVVWKEGTLVAARGERDLLTMSLHAHVIGVEVDIFDHEYARAHDLRKTTLTGTTELENESVKDDYDDGSDDYAPEEMDDGIGSYY